MSYLEQLWYGAKRLKWYHAPLVLLSRLYQLVMKLRSVLYRYNFKKTTNFTKPIIVVGNITAGGTGKTPTVAALTTWLKQQGFKPGIVSRGYKANNKVWPQVVNINSSASTVGDEPLMLFKKTTCPVVVDPNRVRAVTTLLANFDCDVIVSDDGLQHLAMARDIEIALVDAKRKFGNGYCFPAGPLREGVSRLKTVDFVLTRGNDFGLKHSVQIKTGKVIAVKDNAQQFELVDFKFKKIHAVAAIAHPNRFFDLLMQAGLQVKTHAFRDHHTFSPNDFAFLGKDEIVIMTEKDAVKCTHFADHRFFFLAINAELSSDFLSSLHDKLQQVCS